MNQHTMNEESTLGVELSTSRGSLRITFQPHDERAFVVGTSPHADLRLSGPRVGGVAFHLERRGGGVELFPADTTRDLFVDGVRVTRPLLLAETAVVDLPGERLVLTSYDATGLAEATSVRLAEAGIAYVSALPSENDTTRIGIEDLGPDSDAIYEMKTTAFVPEHVHEMKTTAFVPEHRTDLDKTVSFDGRRTEKLQVHQLSRTLPLGPTGTEVIRASDLYRPDAPVAPPVQVITDKITRAGLYAPPPALAPASVAPPSGAASSAAFVAPAPAVPVSPIVSIPPAPVLAPVAASVPPESRGPATTRFDLPDPGARGPSPVPHASIGTDTTELDARKLGLAPPAAPLQRSSPPPSTWASDNPTTISAGPRGQRLRIALRRIGQSFKVGGRRGPGQLVVGLGLLARKRPLAVGASAVAIACALALALTGVAKLAGLGKAHGPRAVAASPAKPKPSLMPSALPVAAVVPQLVIRSAPPPPPADSASPKPRPRGAVVDPDVAAAAADLAAGRDAQARTAYTRLAARSPENPAYESLATLLARAASTECEKDKSGTQAPCPEVRR